SRRASANTSRSSRAPPPRRSAAIAASNSSSPNVRSGHAEPFLIPTTPSFGSKMTMKKDIHPAYQELKVIMTDGTEFVTRSTKGGADAVMRLDIDPKSHPAWTGVHRLND